MSIPTPIPPPLNSHSTCNDAFCPRHDSYFSAVSSSSEAGPGSPIACSITRRTTKKRQRNQKEWSDVNVLRT